MVSQLAREIFHIPNVLARIFDVRREDVFSHFGLHTVCPTNLTVDAIRSALLEKDPVRTVHFGSHTVTFHQVPVPRQFVDFTCEEVNRRLDEADSLFAILHADLSFDIAGKETQRLAADDTMIIARAVD